MSRHGEEEVLISTSDDVDSDESVLHQPLVPPPAPAIPQPPPPPVYVPNPGPSGRGFTVSHQKVALELSFTSAVVLGGYTEITIIPTDRHLNIVNLNLRQCAIQSVTCAGHPATYAFHDHLTGMGLSDPRDVHRYPEFKRRLYAAASDGQGGELNITLPSQIPIEPIATSNTTDQQASASSNANADLAPITIRINYTLSDPVDAIHCVRPSPDAPWKQPHLYTTPTCPDFARCWVPCVDSIWERNTWEFQFVVPSTVPNTISDDTKSRDILVACTGDLVERTAHPHNSSKVIYSFVQAAPTSVHHVGFAAGPFHVIDLSEKAVAAAAAAQNAKQAAAANPSATQTSNTSATTATNAPVPPPAEQDDGSDLQILAFCLPGREAELQSSIGVAKQAMDYYSREFGSYPFGSYKAVFVEDTIVDAHSASTLSIFSSDLLHPSSVVDQALETRQILAHSLAVQWVGINIIQKSWSDTWVIHGLSLYIAGLFWRRLMGNNEYRFRLRKDCDRVCAWDIGMPPLCQVGKPEPPDANLLPFINLKAPLVMHILDKRLCKAGASLGLGRVIPKVFLQAITGELPNNTLSTSSFLRTCRKISTVDLRVFADQWIYGSGCPRFFFSSHFNRKKLTIEIHVRQESPSAQFADFRPELALGSNPVRVFDGQMTIRINEADGRPYEHVLDIKTPFKRFDVPFNTKYKRVRRNTKRFQARQAAAAAAAEGDQDAAEAMGMIDLGFSLAMWENEEQRARWKVADWTEEDEDIMSQAAYEWIRMDSDFEWIASLHVDQPDYMWVSQLQRDRDVVAQLQAVQALSQMPNEISSSMLTRTVLVSKYFFRIRAEAAQAIVSCAIPRTGYLGLFHLLMLFQASYCMEIPDEEQNPDPLELLCIPRPNDFSDPAEYFLKKTIIHAISRIRNERGRTLPQVKQFLISQIRYNDNSTNRFVDDYYVASLISALTSAFVPVESQVHGGFVPANEDPDAAKDPLLLEHACAEVSRLQELDKLVPSFHNVVTQACLEFQSAMTLSSQLPLDLPGFLAYTRPGTFTPLRIAAFNHLLLIIGLRKKKIMRYIFATLRSDDNRAVKRSLAKALCEAMSIAIATTDINTASQLIDGNDLEAADRAKDRDMESALRALRKEVGRSSTVREGFLGALLAVDADSEERWALIKLAELLFKPGEEDDLPIKPRHVARARSGTATGADMSANAAAAKIRLVNRNSGVGEDGQAAGTPRVAFDAPDQASPGKKKSISAKLKKPKPVAQAQAAGMTQSDLTACRNALKKIQSNRHAPLFINPVDPVRDGAPNYHQVIANPMDLSTMENKLEAGLYADRFAFEKDFELLVVNAKTYTPDPSAFVHKEAEALNKAFSVLWTRTNKTLEQAARARGEVVSGDEDPVAAQSQAPVQPGVMAPPPVPVRAPSRPAVATTAPAASPSSTPARPLGLKLKLKTKAPAAATAATAATTTQGDVPSSVTPQPQAQVQESPASQHVASAPVIKEEAESDAGDMDVGDATPSKAKTVIKTKKASSREPHSQSPAPASVTPNATISGIALALPTGGPEDPVNIGRGEPIHAKQCKTLIANLRKLPEAVLFLAPVDEAYAPGYFSIVHTPMDLGTMDAKLSSGKYNTMDEFASDMEQIFANAYAYADTTAVSYAAVLRNAFVTREWPKAMRMEYAEKRTLQGLLSRIKSNPTGGLFAQPISEIVKALPHYFDVIPEEEARDLSMISEKLKTDKYTSFGDLEADVRLMVGNAKKFNAANEGILALVASFEALWNKECRTAGFSGSSKKRKGGEEGRDSPAMKRQKS